MINRYFVSNLIKDVNRKLHEAGVSLSSDFYGAVDEARRAMFSKITPPELERTAFIEQALYDQVDKYAVPSDMEYDNVIDIKQVSSKRNLDTLEYPLQQVYRRRFDQKRRGARNIFSIQYENGVKYMKIFHPRGLRECQHTLVNKCESLTENGTWNVGGNVVNLQVDKVNHITGKASLQFDFNDSSTEGYIENASMTAVDLADVWDTGDLFTWLELTRLNVLTSCTIRIGSDISNYYEFTVNSPHDNNQFLTMWNLIGMRLNEFTQVGFPNIKQLTYLRVGFTTTGEIMTKCHLDNVVARKGVLYQCTYQSVYIFVDPEGYVWKQTASKPTDIIVAEEDTYQIFMLETAKAIMQEAYGNNDRGLNDIQKINDALNIEYGIYANRHKSEMIEEYDSSYIFGEMYSGLTDTPMNRWGEDDGPHEYYQNTNHNGGC